MQKKFSGLVLRALSLSTVGLPATGCGETYADEAFGVLDLTPVYDRNNLPLASPADTNVPERISPLDGFMGGERAEYYDFGPVPTIRDPSTGTPVAARVQAMYFFFTGEGLPLFAAPIREKRDGADHMPGGKKVLNPGPKDFCVAGADPVACAQRNADQRKIPYPLRQRDYLTDPLRGGSADYQRPLVDISPDDISSRNPAYTGLWEVIEVTVPKGYDPDAIKQVSTLERAVSSGDFKTRNTGKVINCPIIDERSYVPPGVTDRLVRHPRIEIWYRRKLAFCFLASGWETLGDDAGRPFFGPAGGVNSDSERLDTFDVSRLQLGEDKAAQSRLLVPVTKMVIPAIFTDDQTGNAPTITRLPDNILSNGRPRHFRNDPFGYSPIRWMWDLQVYVDYKREPLKPDEPRLEGIKSLEDTNPDKLFPRRPLATRNFPLRGMAAPCSFEKITKRRPARCGQDVQDPADPTNPNATITDPKGDPVCVAQGLECNPDTCYCDAPFVGYGQPCGPGIAQCGTTKEPLSEFGSTCFPWYGGFCYRRCQGMNFLSAQNAGKKANEFVDSRCGGLPGYKCFLPYDDGSHGICLKNCDQNITDPKDPDKPDNTQCAAAVTMDTDTKDIGAGQTCQGSRAFQVCAWPDNYTPN